MKRLFTVILLGFLFCNSLFSQEIPTPVWGIYLDLYDVEARRLTNNLADVGYALHTDTLSDGKVMYVLVPGDIEPLVKTFRKKRSDGVKVVYVQNQNCEGNEEKVSTDSLIRYKFIRNNFIQQYNTQLPYVIPEKIQESDSRISSYISTESKKFNQFLKQKSNVKHLGEISWIMLGSPVAGNDEITFRFIKKNKEMSTLRFDTLYGEFADRFFAVKDDECAPFNRNTEFKRIYAERPVNYPRNYRPRSEKLIRKEFEITFEKNQTTYAPSVLKPIIKLMTDSSYSIISAKVEGFASVEGTMQINQSLQEKRAKVLIDVLEKYNDERIELDTVITTENWALFFNQIKGTKWKFLRNLSRDQIKDTLLNENLAYQLEPLLSTQRKAVLKLVVGQKLAENEKLEMAFSDLEMSSVYLCRKDIKLKDVNLEERLMGILHYLEDQVGNKKISAKRLREAYGSSERELDILFLKAYSDYNLFQEKSIVFPLEEIINKAFELHVLNYDLYHTSPLSRMDCLKSGEYSWRRLGSIQFFIETLVKRKEMNPEILANLSYPDESGFFGLTLSLLEVKKAVFMVDRNVLETTLQSDGLLRLTSEIDAYYYLIKKIVLENNQQILREVYRSDNLYYFDLAEFVYINVMGWDADKNILVDTDVTQEIMRKFV
ncbi:MAG: hypothetical protein OEW75_15020, partial [Cyclobacteriaceae bacterium]|nr:hypothetical protein [Cyclobacteriaceae bacterium]